MDIIHETLALVQIEISPRADPINSQAVRAHVALARALANHPKILLLDEPLGALDKKLREETQFELVNIHIGLASPLLSSPMTRKKRQPRLPVLH